MWNKSHPSNMSNMMDHLSESFDRDSTNLLFWEKYLHLASAKFDPCIIISASAGMVLVFFRVSADLWFPILQIALFSEQKHKF